MWSSLEVPVQVYSNLLCVQKDTDIIMIESQGKLHSLVTLMQQLWSSDTGSTSSAFLDSEGCIV